jgi:hypothetical protein
MPITTVVPHAGGGAWGWDDTAGKWVPVDEGMQGGSFLGNIGRSAATSFEQMGAGIQSIGGQDQQAKLTGDILRLQGESEANAAPWAAAIGTGVPDVLAGVAAGAATGGMGVPAMLAGQAAAGAFTAGIRPGSVEERVGNAAMGAGLGIAGGFIGEIASKGIAAALEVGRGIATKNGATIARAVETGGQRVANAQARAEMEATAAAQAAGEGGAPGVSPQPGAADASGISPQGSTAGAAQTPGTELPEDTRMWNSALNEDDAHAAGVTSNPRVGQIMSDARDIGYEPSLWAEAGKGSRSRLMGALEEFSPAKDSNEAARVTKNAELINRSAAKSLGLAMTLDPEENTFTRITAGDLSKVEDYLDQGYKSVAKELPSFEPKRILNAIADVDENYRHLAGDNIGQKTIDDLRYELNKSDTPVNGQTFMNTIQALTGLSADAYSKPGGAQSGQMLYDAVNALYNLGEKATKDAPAAFGRGTRDAGITGKGWTELRREANMFMILRRPGAIDPAGNVNPRTVYNAMAKQKTAGGFGRGGPPKGNSNYELFKLSEAHGYDQTGVPPTGVRLAGFLAKPALRNAGAAAGAAGGVAGLQALGGSIWGK